MIVRKPSPFLSFRARLLLSTKITSMPSEGMSKSVQCRRIEPIYIRGVVICGLSFVVHMRRICVHGPTLTSHIPRDLHDSDVTSSDLTFKLH